MSESRPRVIRRPVIRLIMADKKKHIEDPGNEKVKEEVRKEPQEKEEVIENKELEKLEEKVRQQKDDYLRLMAEFDTFRRRTAEEKLALVSTAAADTIKGLLPILDDCEIALQQLDKSSDSDAAKEGTALIFNKLKAYLKSRGLEEIDALGKEFDTEFHEAVTMFPAPSEELKGKVIDVTQTGYTLSGKVLRYAKVIVGA